MKSERKEKEIASLVPTTISSIAVHSKALPSFVSQSSQSTADDYLDSPNVGAQR